MFRNRQSNLRVIFRFAAIIVLSFLSLISAGSASSARLVDRTWDGGGGADQNWSNPLNWSGDTLPGSNDIAVFGAASGNSTIDGAFAGSVQGIQTNAGFAGTITQSANLSVGGSGFSHNAGTFNAGGTMQLQGNLTVGASATFNAGTGTLVFNGVGNNQGLNLPASFTVNNLTVNKTTGTVLFFNTGSTNLIIAGTLTLNDGGIQDNTSVSTFEAQGPVLIASTFDGGTGPLLVSGAATRTITLPAGAGIPRTTVNAANVTLDTSGTGTITFTQPFAVTSSAGFTNGSVNFVFNQPFTFTSTTNFVPAGGNLTFDSSYTQTGGTFTPGGGSVSFNSNITINGGTFNAPGGTMELKGNLTVGASGTLNAGTGTLVFNGVGNNQGLNLPASLTVNNLTVNKTTGTVLFFNTGSTNLIIAGALTLTDGGLQDNTGASTFNAQGPVSIASTFDGGTGPLLVSGAATRTITLPAGAGIPRMTVDAANVTIDTSGAGTITFAQPFAVTNSTSFTNGSVNFTFNQTFTFGAGTNFALGSGSVTFDSTYNQTGGTFSPGTGAVSFNGTVSIVGGTFNAPSGPMALKGSFSVGASATFVAGTGTLVFDGVGNNQDLNLPASLTVNNLTVNKTTGTVLFFNTGSTNLIITGTLTLTDGGLQDNTGASTFNARGPISIASTFDGGVAGLTISGAVNQTYTNAGGLNPSGAWTINKSGGAFTLASNLTLGTTQALNITAGEFSQGSSSDLRAGAVTVGATGLWRNNGTGDITLGGNVSNAGEIDIDGTTISCDEADQVLIRSTSPGVQRTWSGAGSFFVQDADVQDQAGTAAITAHASTNVGNNGGNWTFNGQCAPFVWDGGGVTNNWSEAANWKRNLVPINTLTVHFDATSSKNAVLDTSRQVNGMRIENGYTGTISHLTSSTLLVVGSGSGTNDLVQSGGTYSPSALEVNGSISILGGTFSPTSALKDLNGNLTVSNATYTGNGTTRLSGNLTVTTPISFSPGPLFEFDGSTNATVSVPNGTQFDGVNIIKISDSSLSIFAGSGMAVTGELQLVDGLLDGEAITVTGVFTTNPGFDGGNGGVSIQDPSPGGTIGSPGFSPGLPASILLNSPGATLSSLGSPFFQSLIVQNGTFEMSGGATVQGSYSQSGGTFRHSFADLTFGGNFTQTGGTFENSVPGGGLISMNGDVVLNGGTFTSTSTDLMIFSDFRINGTTFNHNNGRVRFLSASPWSLKVGTNQFVLNRANFEASGLGVVESLDGTSWITTLGTANFSAGGFELAQGAAPLPSFRVEGNVSIASTFNGAGFNLRFQSGNTQSLTQNSLATFDRWAFDKSGGTVNLLTNLNVPTSLSLANGTITTGSNKVSAPSSGVSQTNGYVIGNFEQVFGAPGSTVFAVGTASGPSPVTVNVTAAQANLAGGGPAGLTISATQENRPGMRASESVGRFWTITESGDITADLTFNYPQTDANGNETVYRLYRWSGGLPAEVPSSLDINANTVFTAGISDFSDWSIGVLAPTAAPATISGRVVDRNGRGIKGAFISVQGLDGSGRTVVSNTFGNYRIEGLTVGVTYILQVSARRYSFLNATHTVNLEADLAGVDFVATEP